MKKLFSRKLWVTILNGILLYLNAQHQWGIPPELIAGSTAAYVIGQSYADGKSKE